MPIERDLHELLYAHDCVIVPRFGGFLTHYRPARLDEQRRSIHPPSKDLSFNRHLTRTDGLLTDHLAKAQGLDFIRAAAVIDGEVDVWQGKLDRDGRLELPRIGTFYRDAERNIQFDPDRRVNFLKDAYGLRSVPAVPCLVTVAAPVVAVPLPEPRVIPLVPVEELEGRRFPWLAAAAVLALLSTAGTWWIVSSEAPSGAQWSGFELFGKSEPLSYHPRLAEDPVILDPVDTATWTLPLDVTGVREVPAPGSGSATLLVDLGAPMPPPRVEISPEKQVAVPESTAVAVKVPHNRFHVIGGCFLQKENAEGFMADLRAKGFAADIIDRKGGLYRVAIGSYPQRALALEALTAVRKEDAPQAWLLVR
ncbi:MAG: SPOR domain-containing protein [Flavobacteriales bacterium]|nr:SPOR domain-containing protein [Flavobacteriales bacterium]